MCKGINFSYTLAKWWGLNTCASDRMFNFRSTGPTSKLNIACMSHVRMNSKPLTAALRGTQRLLARQGLQGFRLSFQLNTCKDFFLR